MARENDADKLTRFEAALRQFVERIAEDRYVLAVVLVGSRDDVVAVVNVARRYDRPIVPRCAGTGLSCGAILSGFGRLT